jgi:hypothetical protein
MSSESVSGVSILSWACGDFIRPSKAIFFKGNENRIGAGIPPKGPFPTFQVLSGYDSILHPPLRPAPPQTILELKSPLISRIAKNVFNQPVKKNQDNKGNAAQGKHFNSFKFAVSIKRTIHRAQDYRRDKN